jgi:TolB-like protein/Tfp pilus assembly protein PilF
LLGAEVSSLLTGSTPTGALASSASETDGSEPRPEPEPHLATVAVLPFQTERDPARAIEERSFADGIAEDLIARLCRLWFPVISRGSTLDDRASGSDRASHPAHLDADYHVEGSVRRGGDRVRVNARLIQRSTGRVVWAGTYDRAFSALFECQDDFTTQIVSGVGDALLVTEAKSLAGQNPSDLEAWQLGLLGTWHYHRRVREANHHARDLLRTAVQRDRFQPLAWYTLAFTHQQDLLRQWAPDPRSSLQQMAGVASEYSGLFPNHAGSHVASAYVHVYLGERDAARSRLTEAIQLDPNMVPAYSLYGQTLAMGGDCDRAIEQFELGFRLSPRDSERWTLQLGVALSHFVAERYEAAIAAAEQAVPIGPGVAFPFGVLASAHAHLGNLPEAREALRQMLTLEPQTTSTGFGAIIKATRPDIAQRYLEGLARAGMAR